MISTAAADGAGDAAVDGAAALGAAVGAAADGAVDAPPLLHAPKTTAAVKTLRLFLKYGPHGERLITGVQRISRPGRRVYFGRDDVPDVLAGLGTSILTTSRGVMTGRAAVKAGVGGEVL